MQIARIGNIRKVVSAAPSSPPLGWMKMLRLHNIRRFAVKKRQFH
jgi:hypothetical protein